MTISRLNFIMMEFCELFENDVIYGEICKHLTVKICRSLAQLYRVSCLKNNSRIKKRVIDLIKRTDFHRLVIVEIKRKGLLGSFLKDYSDEMPWGELENMYDYDKWVLVDEDLEEFSNFINWKNISERQILSEEFIRKHSKYVNWPLICQYQKLSEDFIREFVDKVDWEIVSGNGRKLSESFIRDFAEKVNWENISRLQTLSEDFIREFAEKVDWEIISWSQKMSEDFIREFRKKVQWYYILKFQKLTVGFVKEFERYFAWYIFMHKLPDNFKDRFYSVFHGIETNYSDIF